ncbi:type I-E CRISPR-associated protein Cas7/Cse4/CasC [Streptomyces sp. PSKA54]|uniref:Type I-E CRISPR-associated protein Cas7/Cse4/CasC n=1 Tax=Streptomyces himalayensis subsp. aureolus TaxID=2758039 RepID=A0A7W2D761_9ACTN|nr:type I-E CRISPR-associated protein Cas7/Cse4/CasC [Streptomyces himalayensis]MBA4865992.1 type I-E CRISPR-associated protein Cas7/Cse4/CasC [Streptomyces himalayensis subsp. aureolus]
MPARYIDFHALQAIPASLLNRGEDNEPKTMLLGGAIRAMVSSQSWKRSLRLDLEKELDEHAARTRMLPLRVADALRDNGWPDDLAIFAGAQITRSASREGLKTEPQQNGITSAMLLLPRDVLDEMVSLCEKHRGALEEAAAQRATEAAADKPARGTKKKTSIPAVLPSREVATLIKRRTATINLFGRMLAEIPDAHVDGAVQIAPAFTVHKSDRQPDFFTAVEEWGDPDDSGSAHLQTAFFTTGVLYRYATVNLTELTDNLGGDHEQARRLLDLFADAFIMSLPQAKKTSTAPHTVPYLVHYAVRDRRPVSYAAAFEQPVKTTRDGGYTQPALTALSQHAAALNRLIGTRRLIAHGHATFATVHDKPVDNLGTHHTSFEELTDALTAAAALPSPTAPVTA